MALADKKTQAALFILLFLVSIWLLLPVATPVHVEGFSASIIALGLHMARGSLAQFDLLYPLNVEYFGLTKLGTEIAVAGLSQISGVNGDLAMRLIMWTGFAALLTSSLVLVRRWSGAPWWMCWLGLLIVPGVTESAFFFNDNVFAAGLAVTSLALLYRPSRMAVPFVAGLLFGFSVLSRTDMAVLAPAVAVILIDRSGFTRDTIVSALVAGVGGGIALFGTLALFDSTIFDVLTVGRQAIDLWDRGPSFVRQAGAILFFTGLPAMLLIPFGLLALVERRAYLLLGMLAGMPILVCVVGLGTLWEARQLLGLSPFVATLVAAGVCRLFTASRSFVLPAAMGIAITVILLTPPFFLRDADGPRSPTGRLLMVGHWKQWQQGVTDEFTLIRQIISLPQANETLAIVTDQWNEDRYLHLTLLEQGYTPDDTANARLECEGVGERWTKADRKIVAIRPQLSFVPLGRAALDDQFANQAQPCLAAAAAERRIYIGDLRRSQDLFDPALPETGSVSLARNTLIRNPWLASYDYNLTPMIAITLSPSLETRLLDGYAKEAAEAVADPKYVNWKIKSIDEAVRATRGIVPFPG